MKAIVHRDEDRTKAVLISIMAHLGLMALLMFYTFADAEEEIYEPPPVFVNIEWGGGGDDAAEGQRDRGMNSTSAPVGEPASEEVVEETPIEAPAEPTPTPPAPAPPAKTEKVEAPKPVPTTEDPSIAALRRQQEETKRKQEQEQSRIRQEQEKAQAAERERQRIAQAAAAEKARQDKERRDKIKNSGLGGGGTGGTGQGTGTGGKPGNQGIPGGTGSNPFGQSPGSGGGTGGGQGTGAGGSVGGGLGGRKVLSLAKAAYNSQKQGTVRVKICVDSNGKVISAEPTQSGSTTTDGGLRAAATAAARQGRFAAEPGADTQCGWIEYNFILK